MTDYLYTVQKLVERLDLHPGISEFHQKKTRRDISRGSISDLTENLCDQVIYRHRKQTKSDDLRNKSRKKSRDDSVCLSTSGTFTSGSSTSDTLPKRRKSLSLYQLIKSKQEKGLSKNDPVLEINVETPNDSLVLDNRDAYFQYNVESTSARNNDDDEAPSPLPTIYKKHSLRGTAYAYSSLLSPITPAVIGPPSQTNFRNSDQKKSKMSISDDTLKSPKFALKSPSDFDMKSPTGYAQKSPPGFDPVFSDVATSGSVRQQSGKSRTRLSASKSVPLSPPAANAEKVAQQNCDFQFKLDTLRAELLAMRKADQELAKRLLGLYNEIQVLKVKNSCMNYSELLDEAYYEAEIADEVPDLCDAPQRFTNKLLTSHGVTNFNIHSRRFSCS